MPEMFGSQATRPAAVVAAALLLAACSGGESTADPSTVPPSTGGVSTTSLQTTTSSIAPASGTGQWAIPPGEVPVIDGVQASGEWSAATEVLMSDGSPVLAMHSGGALYLAVSTGRIGAVNVAIATEAEVWILHSSAALGSARYVPGDAGWELAHDFDWCCRSVGNDADRLALLEDEGWQANIGFAGDPGVVEYQIVLPWAGAVIAVASITDASSQAFWPSDLSAVAREQLIGSRPSDVVFRLSEWFTAVPLDP